jgi:hypothetical protein
MRGFTADTRPTDHSPRVVRMIRDFIVVESSAPEVPALTSSETGKLLHFPGRPLRRPDV